MTSSDIGNVFLVDWYDSIAGLTKQFVLTYYERDSTVEMFDPKNRRSFLKRSLVENVNPSDFFIGNSLNILSRQLNVVAYGDSQTQIRLSQKTEKTVVIIKPDAFCKAGKILDQFYKCGFQIIKMKSFILSTLETAEFYSQYKDVQDEKNSISHLASGSFLVVEIMGENILSRVSSIVGPPEPSIARKTFPGSIRAKFGTDLIANAIECPTSQQSKTHIFNFFFGQNATQKALKNSATFDSATCVVIKPHAIIEGKAGEILTRISECNFDITALSLHKLDKVNVEEFFEVYRGVVQEYPQIVGEMASGACIAMEARGQNAVKRMRELCGPHDSEMARSIRPNSLRAVFGKNKFQNAVHCTDLPEDANLELEYFFKILD